MCFLLSIMIWGRAWGKKTKELEKELVHDNVE